MEIVVERVIGVTNVINKLDIHESEEGKLI